MFPPTFIAAIALFFAELLLVWKRPQLLARLAFVPMGLERTFHIPVGALEADAGEHRGGYRDAAIKSIEPAALPWPESLATGGGRGGHIEGTGSYWFSVYKRVWGSRMRGTGRIAATVDGDRVTLRARCTPFPLSAFIILPIFWLGPFVGTSGAAFSGNAGAFVVVAIVLAANLLWIWSAIRSEADAHMAHIEQEMTSV